MQVFCDFDGTISHYNGWVDETHCGEPVPAMINRVKQWLSEGKEVRIFTARVTACKNLDGTDRDLSHVVNAIQDWCEVYVGARDAAWLNEIDARVAVYVEYERGRGNCEFGRRQAVDANM